MTKPLRTKNSGMPKTPMAPAMAEGILVSLKGMHQTTVCRNRIENAARNRSPVSCGISDFGMRLTGSHVFGDYDETVTAMLSGDSPRVFCHFGVSPAGH